MTTTTTVSASASGTSGALAAAENVLDDIGQFVPAVATVAATIPGAAPYVSLALTLYQAITNGISLIKSEQGKTFEQAILDVISHLTPGQPNSPVLS